MTFTFVALAALVGVLLTSGIRATAARVRIAWRIRHTPEGALALRRYRATLVTELACAALVSAAVGLGVWAVTR